MQSPSTEPRRIRRLADSVINQIAAGEVIERPASVLKELVENALDAGCARIEIDLLRGGLERLSVADDGCGIPPDDLPLCIERHATSKLEEASDLVGIKTFGFRGEALAAISAVGELEIVTCERNAPSGSRLRAQFGHVSESAAPCSAPAGTRVTVSKLFERIPARLKFMRQAATEFSHCARTVRELALANPEVSFFLRHQGRLVHDYRACSRATRVTEALDLSDDWLHVLETGESMGLEAFLSPPHQIADKGDLLLVINRRSVRHRALIAAARAAYQDTLGPHHTPSGVLYLDLTPDWLDVNVHPQKLEVRLWKQERVLPWIVSSIRKKISVARSMREVSLPVSRLAEPELRYESSPSENGAPALPSAPTPRVSVMREELPVPRFASLSEPIASPAPAKAPEPPPLVTPASASPLRYLGQVKASYLVCEDEKGIVLIDQHALHEKHEYERLRAAAGAGPMPVQRLLVPRILRVPPELGAVLLEAQDSLQSLGFEIEDFGGQDIAVKAIPACLSEERAENVLRELAANFLESDTRAEGTLERSLTKFYATIACHSVVRANQRLSTEEAERLLALLPDLEQGWTCPHGRPVLFRLTFDLIEKHFERI